MSIESGMEGLERGIGMGLEVWDWDWDWVV